MSDMQQEGDAGAVEEGGMEDEPGMSEEPGASDPGMGGGMDDEEMGGGEAS